MFLFRSLRRQLNLAIVLILLLSFAGSVIINISNSRQFFDRQLTSIAINTTKHLSQQLPPLIESDDITQIRFVINDEFESGDLKTIKLSDRSGKVIYQRNKDNTVLPPQWFMYLVSLHPHAYFEVLESNWLSDHIIEVVSDNSFAMLKLWENTLEVAFFALVVFLITLLFGYLLLQQIYHPLIAISLKAQAVQQHDYVEIKKIPWAIELKNVVLSMNMMVKNIKKTFDELTQAAELTRQKAYIDVPTKIPNSRAFNDLLDEYLSNSSDYQGFIGLIRITQLDKLNQIHGYQVGDQLILNIIKEVKETLEDIQGFSLFRKSGSEISFFLENLSEEEIKSICTLLASRFKKLEAKIDKTTTQNIISFGLLEFDHGFQQDELLATADELTLNAQDIAAGYRLQLLSTDHHYLMKPLKSQKVILQDILSTPKSSINLRSQKVLPFSEENCFDYEIFTSFIYEKENLNATEVFSIANKHHLTAELDIAIIKKIIFSISEFVDKHEVLAVSIAHHTFTDSNTINKIIRLIDNSKLAEHFVIQVHERSVVSNLEHALATVRQFKKIGCKVCINHFGSSIDSLHYLMEIQPEFVKIAPSFTRNIDQKSDNFQVVAAFVRMAHGLGIPVLGHCVETNEELKTLSSLHLDAALGYIIDKPKVTRRQGVPDFINPTSASSPTLQVDPD